MLRMEEAVDGSAAVQLDRFRHFPEPVAQQIRDPLQAVFDRIDV